MEGSVERENCLRVARRCKISMLSVWRWTSGCSSGEKVDDDDVCARKSKLGGSTESSWPSAHIGRAGHMRRRLYELLIESYSLYGMQRRIARRAVLQEGTAFRNRASKYNTGSGKVYRSLSQTEGLAVRISACGLERLASGCVRSARLYDKDLKCAADGRGGRAKVVVCCERRGAAVLLLLFTLIQTPSAIPLLLLFSLFPHRRGISWISLQCTVELPTSLRPHHSLRHARWISSPRPGYLGSLRML